MYKRQELIDRFGDIPKKVEKLLDVAGLKAAAHNVYVTSVEQKGDTYFFNMYEKAKIQISKIPGLLEEFRGELSIKTDSASPCFVYEKKRRNKKEKGEDTLAVVKNVLNGIRGLIEQ